MTDPKTPTRRPTERANNGGEADRAFVRRSMEMFDEVTAERDQLRAEIEKLRRDMIQDRVEAEAVKALVATLESRCQSHQLERDQAVAERAGLEGLFVSMMSMMRAHRTPAAPLIKSYADEKEQMAADDSA